MSYPDGTYEEMIQKAGSKLECLPPALFLPLMLVLSLSVCVYCIFFVPIKRW